MSALIDVTSDAGGFSVRGTPAHGLSFDRLTSGDGAGPTLSCGWTWSEGEGLTLWADRLGFLPLFVWQLRERIVASDELALLLREVGEPAYDEAALAVFFRYGFFIGDDTPFRGVRVLPPGARMLWRGVPLAWDDEPYQHISVRMPRPEAKATYARLFAAAVARRLPLSSTMSLPLSGGRDSRHILLQLHALGCLPVEAITVYTPLFGASEIASARRLASHFGIPHKVAKIDYAALVEAELSKNRLTHCLSDEHAWYLSALACLDPRSEMIFDGIGGDVLSNGLFFDEKLLHLLRRGAVADAARIMLPDSSLPFLSDGFRARVNYDLACSRLERELARHTDVPNPVKSFYFWNRTRREIALSPFCLAGRRVQVATPYLDADVLDFLMSLPAEEFGAAGFHDEVIAAAFPQEASMPYADKRQEQLPRAENRRISLSLLRFFARHPRVAGVRAAYAWPRIAAALLRGGNRELWWAGPALYLHSLRELAARKSH
jgi:hypothetical protein